MDEITAPIMSLIRPLSADEMPGYDEILVRARLVTGGKEFRLAVHMCLHVWEISHYLAKEMRHMGWGRIIRTHANLPLTIGGVDMPDMIEVKHIVRRLKGASHVMHVHIIQQDTPCLFGKTKRAIRKAKRALGLLRYPTRTVSEDVAGLMEAADHVEADHMLHALSHTLHGIMNPPIILLPTVPHSHQTHE